MIGRQLSEMKKNAALRKLHELIDYDMNIIKYVRKGHCYNDEQPASSEYGMLPDV